MTGEAKISHVTASSPISDPLILSPSQHAASEILPLVGLSDRSIHSAQDPGKGAPGSVTPRGLAWACAVECGQMMDCKYGDEITSR